MTWCVNLLLVETEERHRVSGSTCFFLKRGVFSVVSVSMFDQSAWVFMSGV